MRFRFTTSMASAVGCFTEGTVIDVLDVREEPVPTWLRAGLVVPVKGDDDEIAVAPPIESAAVRLRRGRGGLRRGPTSLA